MPSLYNCKREKDGYRISKFTSDLEVEASYLTSLSECECPAGHRSTCRHRQMIPLFEAKSATSGQFFLDFDRKVWIRATPEEFAGEMEEFAPEGAQAGSEAELVRQEIVRADEQDEAMSQGEDEFLQHQASAAAHGFTMLGLISPVELHSTIADALGEPTSPNSDFVTAMRAPLPHIPTVPTPGPELGSREKSDLRRI